MTETLELLKEFIKRPSITPNDAGCQTLIIARLKKLGFRFETMRFDNVDNLWARYGTKAPLVVFAGHTDVVPPGPLENWNSPPFEPTEKDGHLYGRGAADMKSGLAAMLIAVEKFITKNPDFPGSIGFLVTSDEEGPTNHHGTKRVVKELIDRNEKMDYCIIGEASSEKQLGDQIRVGRRGSLSGKLTIFGKQGHVAFPHLAENPIHSSAAAIDELTSITWDRGNDFFPPTTFQITHIQAGAGAGNVIPGSLEIHFNFRFSTAVTVDELQRRFADILMNHSLNFDLKWELSGNPFLTNHNTLIPVTEKAIKKLTGINTHLSTGGGTSDGRFIAETGAEIVELGPINRTIHQVNECINVSDLNLLVDLYLEILTNLIYPAEPSS